jgi:hypothetical protein
VHRSWFPSQADRYGADVRANLEAGAGLTSLQYLEAVALRRRITDTFTTVFDEVDVLATPTVPFVATPIGQDWVELDGEREPLLPALLRCGTLASCIGSPALSVPSASWTGCPWTCSSSADGGTRPSSWSSGAGTSRSTSGRCACPRTCSGPQDQQDARTTVDMLREASEYCLRGSERSRPKPVTDQGAQR